MKLRQIDFFTKYNMEHYIAFDRDNIIIRGVDDWDKIQEIQKYVLSSDNCYFTTLEYEEMVIRID